MSLGRGHPGGQEDGKLSLSSDTASCGLSPLAIRTENSTPVFREVWVLKCAFNVGIEMVLEFKKIKNKTLCGKTC